MRINISKYTDVTDTETFIRAHINYLPGNVTLIQGYPPRIGDAPPSLSERATRFIVRHVGSAWLDTSKPLFTLEYWRLLRSCAPDVVLAEYGPTGIALQTACKMLSVPYVVHFHGFDAHGAKMLEKYGDRYPSMLQGAAAVVGVSRKMCAQLVELGASGRRVFLNPCGVDVEAFVPSAEPCTSRTNEPIRFLAVGRFVEKKAPHLTLLAFRQVLEKQPRAHLQMIGNGPLLSACKDLSMALGIERSVTFSGFQPHRAVQQAMHSAHVFVQHSLTDQQGNGEGSLVAIIEAGAGGLPTVSTRHAGIPDIVTEGVTGFLVDEHDVDAMADRMLRLTEQPDQRCSMGENARKRIERCFAHDKSIGRLHAILQWAADRRTDKPPLLPQWLNAAEGSSAPSWERRGRVPTALN